MGRPKKLPEAAELAPIKKGEQKLVRTKQGGITSDIAKLNVAAVCAEYGYDPLRAMVEIAQNNGASLDLKAGMAKEIAKYVYPQQKSIDLNANVSNQIQVEIVRFSDVVHDDE